MLMYREQIEEREKKILAAYAAKSIESKGRKYKEIEDPFRTCFQRDRDRIIHTKAFRRLKGKTQVFVSHYGDHYRSRLSHTMEVVQLSRDIARMLNLNEDLAESIALAHDLGHTPFGHAGQDEMHIIMQEYNERFEHNEQSRRIVEFLEHKSHHYLGLNLTFEVCDGLIKHRTFYDHPQSSNPLSPSLESQIVNVADEIAYLNHDIDDGLRSDILKMENLDTLEIWQRAKENIDQNIPFDLRIKAVISNLITLMVDNLAKNTTHLLQENNIINVEGVYKYKNNLAIFSPDIDDMIKQLKDFLYQNFYQSPGVAEYNVMGKKVIRTLFEKLIQNPDLLPSKIQEYLKTEKPYIVIKDYISGMTDNFALDLYKQFY